MQTIELIPWSQLWTEGDGFEAPRITEIARWMVESASQAVPMGMQGRQGLSTWLS